MSPDVQLGGSYVSQMDISYEPSYTNLLSEAKSKYKTYLALYVLVLLFCKVCFSNTFSVQ